MAIYNPRPFFNANDRRLLGLLARLILEAEGEWGSNRSKNSAHLSQLETRELIGLLEDFIAGKRFKQTEFFLEHLYSGGPYDDSRLREIYLQWRTFHGRSRALSTGQWRDLLNRLGGKVALQGDTPYWYRSPTAPMDLDYFLRMEGILCDAADIHPQVKSLILSYVRMRLSYVEEVRSGAVALEKGTINRNPSTLLEMLRDDEASKVGAKPISIKRIASVATIVIDLSAAYTTRDWSVAAFFSTIAGAAPSAISD